MNDSNSVEAETIIMSTELQIQEFIESNIWKDMLNEMRVWRQQAEKDVMTVTELRQLGVVQGRCDAIDMLEQLPTVLLTGVEIAKAEALKKKESEENK